VCGQRQVQQVEDASVCGCDGVSVRELDMDLFFGRLDVGKGSAKHDEVAVAATISNGVGLLVEWTSLGVVNEFYSGYLYS
jgi:hypothetical protein